MKARKGGQKKKRKKKKGRREGGTRGGDDTGSSEVSPAGCLQGGAGCRGQPELNACLFFEAQK